MSTTSGQLLQEARERRGVTQSDLAARTGTTQSAISRIENGGVSPTVATLGSMLEALGEVLTLGTAELESGVDRSLLRANLALSPAERVRRGLEFADVVRRNRGVARPG